MAELLDGRSGETLPAPWAKNKKLQRKMTKDDYWISTEENIGMVSNSWNDRNSFIYLYLFESQVWLMF